MTVAIAAMSTYVQTPDAAYVSATNALSLQQWLDVLAEPLLLAPRIEAEVAPAGFVPLPADLPVRPLCAAGACWQDRARDCRAAAAEALAEADWVYLRAPGHEIYWTHQVAERLSVPTLIEFHGDWAEAIDAEDSDSLLRRLSRRFRARAAARAYRRMAEYASAAVTIGPELAWRYVPTHTPLLVSTNHTIPAEKYCLPDDRPLNDPPRLLFVGALERRKGLHVLLAAMAQLAERGLATTLTLAGEGPARDSLAALADRLGLGERVRFRGRVPHGAALLHEYQNADVFVLPSVAGEGVPRVLHEAMAMGCPTVATDVGSTAWQLADGAGQVVPPGQVRPLAAAIEELLTCEDIRHRTAETAYARALEFTYQRQGRRIETFLRQYLPEACRPSEPRQALQAA